MLCKSYVLSFTSTVVVANMCFDSFVNNLILSFTVDNYHYGRKTTYLKNNFSCPYLL